MSDWAEYCDSIGMNAGSENDYDDWLDGLSRSADEKNGVNQKTHAPKVCEPTLSQDEMIELLIKSTCTDSGLDTRVNSLTCNDPNADFDIFAIDGFQEGESSALEITIDHEQYVSPSFLAHSTKLSGVPLFVDDYQNGWIAWDSEEQCLRTGPSCAHHAKNHRNAKSIAREHLHPESEEARLLIFLKRCALSTDHGKKPILLRWETIDEAAPGHELKIENPRTLGSNEHENYVLAFYDRSGKVRVLPLTTAVKLGVPLATRNATYYEDSDTLYPSINNASLLSHGFLMATKQDVSKFDYFRVRTQASIFSSVIERIEPPRNLKYSSFALNEPNDALNLARHIVQWSEALPDTIYVSNGGHPLEAQLVTTPKMLLYATQKLDTHGWVRVYDNAQRKFVMKPKAEISGYGINEILF
ncbi:hypothetical protein [Massilia rubra]|uniref:Uncharacterized protein n=1 Tax=Massilia rubra TaxID=2607910 RepID=A0ABX0LTB3_9BURK|nr:hypothetical protein [Massilia rubra]NHZ37850.1 hypothetical protein [Massilia rubra]